MTEEEIKVGYTGFTFFKNVIDKTPTVVGAWVDVDVSAEVPVGATGVILKLVNTDQENAYRAEVRKNGSTDDFGLVIFNDILPYVLVGIDENRIFEVNIESTVVKVYLQGYTDKRVGFFTNAIDKTPAVKGVWQDVDASDVIPPSATGVICFMYHTAIAKAPPAPAGIRKKGSTDEFTYGNLFAGLRYVYQLCGVENRVFEAKIADQPVTSEIRLVGYTKPPIVFFTNGIDKSITETGVWTDVDVSAETHPSANGAILFIQNSDDAMFWNGDVRQKGSTDDHTAYSPFGYLWCKGAVIGMTGQIFQGWIEDVAIKFYLIGFSTISAEADYDSVLAVGKTEPSNYFRVIPNVRNATPETALPTILNRDGWRSEVSLTGEFVPDYWTFNIILHQNVAKYGGQVVNIRVRLWKSKNPDMTNATALTGWLASPHVITIPDLDTSCNTVTDTFMVFVPKISLEDEFLFIEFYHHIVTAGDSAFCEHDQRCNTGKEYVITALFVPPVVGYQYSDGLVTVRVG